MGIRKLKYLTIFLLPITVSVAFLFNGFFTFLPLLVFFVAVPILEHFLPSAVENFTESERLIAQKDSFYDVLIYAMVPLQVAFVIWYLMIFTLSHSSTFLNCSQLSNNIHLTPEIC